jgi:chemotaxis signal transduction protein
MTTMVGFRVGDAAYCLPVDVIRGVRTAAAMLPLPEARSGVVGVLPEELPRTVIAPLGSDGGQILLVETEGIGFGLLVDAVTDLWLIEDDEIRRSPGSGRSLVAGILDHDGRSILVADPGELAARL